MNCDFMAHIGISVTHTVALKNMVNLATQHYKNFALFCFWRVCNDDREFIDLRLMCQKFCRGVNTKPLLLDTREHMHHLEKNLL